MKWRIPQKKILHISDTLLIKDKYFFNLKKYKIVLSYKFYVCHNSIKMHNFFKSLNNDYAILYISKDIDIFLFIKLYPSETNINAQRQI